MHSGLARCFEATGRLVEAESSFRKAIELEPTCSRYVLLGDVEKQLGQAASGEEALRHALRLEPDNEDALISLAILLRQQSPDEAATLLQHATQVHPSSAIGHRELGFMCGKKGDYAQSEECLRRSLALDAADPWTHIYLAVVLEATKRDDDAEAQLVAACKILPPLSYALRFFGNFCRNRGRFVEAERLLRSAVEVSRKDAALLCDFADLLAEIGATTEARKLCDEALRVDPNEPKARSLDKRLASSSAGEPDEL
jgi:Flp pilus assembly protein TadD